MGAPLEREAALRYQRVLTPRIMNGSETGEGIMRSLKSGYGYVNNDREQAAKFRDGWLYSGDLATGDASGDGLTAAQLGKHAKAHTMLAHYKRPRRYRFVDELPRTATGKKMHYGIRQRLTDPAESAHRQTP